MKLEHAVEVGLGTRSYNLVDFNAPAAEEAPKA